MWSWTFFDDFWENEKPLKPNSFNGFRGRSEETRTPDILVPNAHFVVLFSTNHYTQCFLFQTKFQIALDFPYIPTVPDISVDYYVVVKLMETTDFRDLARIRKCKKFYRIIKEKEQRILLLKKRKKRLKIIDFQSLLVEMTGFEPTAFASRTAKVIY